MPPRHSHPFLVLSLALACGGPLHYDVPSSAVAPGADAHIVADVRDDQNQTQLELEVQNLAPPSRVEAGSKHFVAWYRRDADAVWARIAGLEYDADAREGRLSGSVPLTRFELEITAEQEASPASPSSQVIFSQPVGQS